MPARRKSDAIENGAGTHELEDGLRSMGLTEYEIRVYLAILRHPMSRIPEIARHSGVPQPKVYATVKRLIGRGLCESHLGSVNTYNALPPKSAFAPLLDDLKSRAAGARDVVKSLSRQHTSAEDPLAAREGRIKLFQGRQATSHNFRFLIGQAEREVALIARRPLIVTDDDEVLAEALTRGVRVRILVGIPDDFDIDREPVVRRQLAMGCDSRRLSRVPMRMAVFDQKIALLPIQDEPQVKGAFTMLEVRNQGLAQGLAELFEMLWEQARPIEAGASG